METEINTIKHSLEAYESFKRLIREETLDSDDYWRYIIKYKQEIIMDVGMSTRLKVAKQLNIAPTIFGGILNVLKAL